MSDVMGQVSDLLKTFSPGSDLAGFNAILRSISALIFPPDTVVLQYVRIEDIREQDLNAQSMSKGMFDQLVSNIEGAGVMESVPLCCTLAGDATIHMVSGHHRLRGSRTAGHSHMLIMVWENLSPDRMRSKQLAHNAIFGQSDPEIVKRIWEQIGDVGARFESYIDPRMFDGIPKPVSFKPIDVDMVAQVKIVVLAFLPVQLHDFAQAAERIVPKGEVDAVYLANAGDYDGVMEAIKRVRQDCDIVALPTAVAMMARLAVERLDQMKAEAEGVGDEQ